MNGTTNEGHIEYTAITGFRAKKRENGLYTIYALLKTTEGKIKICSLNTCKGDHLIDIWEGIRSLAKLLTWDDFFIEI